MDIRTFRAGSLQEALNSVRMELGPDATVLGTREIRGGWFGWSRREIEITASAEVRAPSRVAAPSSYPSPAPPPLVPDYRRDFHPAATGHDHAPSVVAELCEDESPAPTQLAEELRPSRRRAFQTQLDVVTPRRARQEPSPAALELFGELLDADFDETIARQLIDRAREGLSPIDGDDSSVVRARLTRQVEQELRTTGPLIVAPGQRRVVALVGPTGVGKTTTIAKLAAHYRLSERRRVGLISVDTYRIAAVEQLRTYADIIDLPLEVVTTPREMRVATQRLADMELVLIDTAGRSPHDEVRIQELRAFLLEAQADEVHLVLACGSSPKQLQRAHQRFAAADLTAVLLTKLDETLALGGLLPWLRQGGLPVSYVTTGQLVPQDLEPADRRKLALRLLGKT